MGLCCLSMFIQIFLLFPVSEILQVFSAHGPPMPSYLGVFPLNQIAYVGVSLRRQLKREITFEVVQPISSRYLNVTDRQTF